MSIAKETAEGAAHQQQTYKEYRIREEPYYIPVGDEVEIFSAAYKAKLPTLLKGPTGCGKTRFIEYMAYILYHAGGDRAEGDYANLITVACHEDLTASDLIGRYLLQGDETIWIDGPLTKSVKVGAICYLDEIVEARKDTTVVVHPLADHRRILSIEKRNQVIEAHPDFLLAISYNPGYQSVFKDIKQSTRQRFVSLEFDYPSPEIEKEIIAHESGLDMEIATDLARLGQKVRNLKEHGLEEGVSTRLLIYAGQMITQGIAPLRACQVSITHTITDEKEVQQAIDEIVSTIF